MGETLNLCRLCLLYFADTIDMSDSSNEEKFLTEMIFTLFSLEIKSNDIYSTFVCIRCMKHIKNIHTYYSKVKTAQNKLLEMNIPTNHAYEQFNEAHNTQVQSNACNKMPMKSVDFKLYDTSLKKHTASHEILDPEIKLEFKKTANTNYKRIFDLENKSCIDGCDSPNISMERVNQHWITHEDVDAKNILDKAPLEIYKNGKLYLKGTALQTAVKKFYGIFCEVCNDKIAFNTINELYSHYETVHQLKGYLVCCNKRLYHRRTIYTHMARHLQPTAFECPICKKSVSVPNNLIVHLQTHLPESEKPHKCDKCQRRYSCISGLTAHKLTHIPIEDRLLNNCKICGKVFTLSTSFTSHMNVVHAGMKYLCAECGRCFKSKASLNSHMIVHDPVGMNEFKCPQCGLMCKNKRSLKLHLQRHNAVRLVCTHYPECEFNTHLRSRLNIHMKVKHSDSKPFGCTECGKKFKLQQGLRTHMAQHSGERKYCCPFCPKSFIASGNYYTHRKRMHRGLYSDKSVSEITQSLNKIITANSESALCNKKVENLAREQIKIMEANRKKIKLKHL